MKNFVSHSLIETENLAKEWLGSIEVSVKNSGKPGKGSGSKKATVVALNGHLGSGKTTFVQAVARALGVNNIVTSPTFVIMKKYDLNDDFDADKVNESAVKKVVRTYKHLIHIDAYRLEDGADLEALEFKNIIADPSNLVLIEWADNVKGGLPADIKKIDFEYVSENERKISFAL